MRGSYLHHKEIRAAQGVKLAAQNLESAVAGTQLLVVGPDDDVEALKSEVMEDMQDIFSSVDRSGESCHCCHPFRHINGMKESILHLTHGPCLPSIHNTQDPTYMQSSSLFVWSSSSEHKFQSEAIDDVDQEYKRKW